MYVSIHKHLVSFQNCFRFYLRFSRARTEWRFLILNVSSGNIMLCGEQHAVRKQHIEWSAIMYAHGCGGKGSKLATPQLIKHSQLLKNAVVLPMQHTQSVRAQMHQDILCVIIRHIYSDLSCEWTDRVLYTYTHIYVYLLHTLCLVYIYERRQVTDFLQESTN